MALLTDDQDLNKTSLRMMSGGNGDYYIELINQGDDMINTTMCVRVSTSGGNAPTSVKVAVANLFRALEEHRLNVFPDSDF